MSAFHGPMHRGAQAVRREKKRRDALARNGRTVGHDRRGYRLGRIICTCPQHKDTP